MKFGKSVTGSVVKVPEKFGFNWSIFGWFGHFTEHVVGEILGFRRNGHLSSENPPEGARNLQGYSMGTIEHIPPHGCTRFHRIWNLGKRGGNGSLCSPEQRGRRTEGEMGCSPRREGEGHEVAGESPVGGRSPAERGRRQRQSAGQ